jgi:hypothetical protein
LNFGRLFDDTKRAKLVVTLSPLLFASLYDSGCHEEDKRNIGIRCNDSHAIGMWLSNDDERSHPPEDPEEIDDEASSTNFI